MRRSHTLQPSSSGSSGARRGMDDASSGLPYLVILAHCFRFDFTHRNLPKLLGLFTGPFVFTVHPTEFGDCSNGSCALVGGNVGEFPQIPPRKERLHSSVSIFLK